MRRARLLTVVSVLSLPALFGCQPAAPAPTPDAGDVPDAGPDVPPAMVNPPAAPVLPEPVAMLPCPAGWSEVPGADGAPTTCEPWAADAGAGCALDEAHFPGEPSCRRVGTQCTGDDWASGLPSAAPVLYVLSGAPAGGAGTRGSPFGTVAEAMLVANSGAVVALSKGTFSEGVRVRPGVTVWGACAAQTELRGTAAGSPAVAAAGLGGAVKNLRVGGPRVGVMANPSGNSLELSDVVIDGAVGVAILVGNTASVTGHDVVVRNTQLSPASGTGGRAVSAEYGGLVTLIRVAFEGNRENAVSVSEPGSKVSLTDAVIRGTSARADGAMGRAATVNRQAQLSLSRAVLEENQEVAVLVGNNATLYMTDVLVRGTRPAAVLNDGGNGLVIEVGAVAGLTRCTFEGNRSLGISVRSAAQLAASHLVVVDTAVQASTGEDGAGLDVIEGSRLTVDHAFLARNHSAGISVTASTGSLADVDIRDSVASQAPLDESSGLQVRQGAVVDVQRVRVHRSERLGVLVDGTGTSLSGADLVVSETACTTRTGEDGAGLVAQSGPTVTLTRVDLVRNHAVALQATGVGTTVRLEDAALHQTLSEVGSGAFGRGVHAQDGAQLVLTRAAVDHNLDVGLFVGSGASVAAIDLRIDDTGKRACVGAKSCADLGGSAAVVLGANSAFTAAHFGLARSAQCGLQLAEGGVATLSDGDVTGHPIGACVQTTGFDLQRISDRVSYRDNGRKLDAEVVPLPDVRLPKY